MKRVLKNIAYYFFTDLFLKISGLLIYLYLGKLLNPGEFAYLAMSAFVISFSSLFIQMGTTGVLLRDFNESGKKSLVNSIRIIIVLYCIVSPLVLFAGKYLAEINPSFIMLLTNPYLIIIAIGSNTVFNILTSYFIVSQQAGLYSTSVLIKSFLYIILIIPMIKTSPSYITIIKTQLIAELLAVFYAAYKMLRAKQVHVLEVFKIRSVFSSEIFTGINFLFKDMIGNLNIYMSRLLLSSYVSIIMLGVYSYFWNFYINLNMLVTAIDRVYTPSLLKKFNEDSEYGKHLFKSFFHVILPVTVIIYVFGIYAGNRFLFSHILDASYLQYTYILNAIMFLLLISILIQGISFTYYFGRDNKSVRNHTAIFFSFSFVALFLLVPKFGIKGALAAEVISSVFRYITLWLINRRLLDIDKKTSRQFFVPVLLCIVMLLHITGNIGYNLLCFFFTGLAVLYMLLSIEEISYIYKILLNKEKII